MKYFILASILLFLSSSALKLKRKYEHHGADNFYLEFPSKENFELKMYSCLYSLRIKGNYRMTTDTIFLDYSSFETRSEDRKHWVMIDSTNEDYDHISDSQMAFLNKFTKLVRINNDKMLIPYGIRRTFYSNQRKGFANFYY